MTKIIKSPLNYIGGKYKLLPQLIPLFPEKIRYFVDLFSGGSNVGINVKADFIYCNDIQEEVISLMNYIQLTKYDSFIQEIEEIIKEYGLSRSDLNGYDYYHTNSSKGLIEVNKIPFERLRNEYNNGKKTDVMFYALVVFSFNNAIRFNDKGEYNQSCNKRDFNNNLRNSLKLFMDKLENTNITFTNNDFRNFYIENINSNDFVYCDPPYLISGVAYNENNHGWTLNDELDLYKYLDSLNEKGVKFALSNIARNKGKDNHILLDWANKYKIIELNHTYKNSYYSSKDKSENSTSEVLIVNYA
jgi:DNA adenine methylase Dam